jgi:hypothetical protein
MLMRKFAAVLMFVVAVTSYAESKQDVAGSYRGPSESYGLVLEVAADGSLRGNYVEMGRVAVLNAIAVDGSTFTASASFDDGSSKRLSGSLTSRGLRMHAVPVEGRGNVDTFFERL